MTTDHIGDQDKQFEVSWNSDLYAHVEQHGGPELVGRGAAQVVEQRAVPHVLRHDVDGPVLAAHAVQLHQVLVLQLAVGRQCCISSIMYKNI